MKNVRIREAIALTCLMVTPAFARARALFLPRAFYENLLLLNRYVLASLLLLGPVVVHILLYPVLIGERQRPAAFLNFSSISF
jgi:hypothetical protein